MGLSTLVAAEKGSQVNISKTGSTDSPGSDDIQNIYQLGLAQALTSGARDQGLAVLLWSMVLLPLLWQQRGEARRLSHLELLQLHPLLACVGPGWLQLWLGDSACLFLLGS